ncbi:MAG: hypothetical protein M3O41_17895 [Pseudomonadota bacterium]|nr:hypothetical protein [Pseudomonadota bacterium]
MAKPPMSQAGESNGINIRSPSFFLARTVGTCGHCRRPTSLFALAVPPGHRTLELDHDGEAEDLASDAWLLADHCAFLFHIEFLPTAVQVRVKQLTQSDRFGFSDAATGALWGNHCDQCDSFLNDEELFCEPEGAFLPTSESSAGLIHLLRIDEEFEATAAGYAFEPPFFDAMATD